MMYSLKWIKNKAFRRAITIVGIVAILTVVTNVLSITNLKGSSIVPQTEESISSEAEVLQQTDDPTTYTASEGIKKFLGYTGFANASWGNIVMILIGLVFIYLAIKYDYEPLLLIPIGTGIIIGNIPFFQAPGVNLQLGIYQEGSVLNYLYYGVTKGIYPPLIFLGIGAMTDFSSLISSPRLVLLGAAAQVGIFLTLLGALFIGFNLPEAASIGIIGGADGPTAIFLS